MPHMASGSRVIQDIHDFQSVRITYLMMLLWNHETPNLVDAELKLCLNFYRKKNWSLTIKVSWVIYFLHLCP